MDNAPPHPLSQSNIHSTMIGTLSQEDKTTLDNLREWIEAASSPYENQRRKIIQNKIRRSFYMREELDFFNFINFKLTSVPSAIFTNPNFQKLTSLYLQQNKLTNLPSEIANLQSLQILFLNQNRFSSFPECICDLKNLCELNISKNKLKSLPKSLAKLQSLKILNLNFNNILFFPECICELTSLKGLYLKNNNLVYLPENIANLQVLEDLRVSFNNLLFLPNSIGKLKDLTHLDVNDNVISKLPESFRQLSKLRILCLNDNYMSFLPEFIGEMNSLEELYLRNNRLQSLPESFANLSKLSKLQLSNNQLSTLEPWFSNLRNLKILGLNSNQVFVLRDTTIPCALQHLLISNNRLRNLPDSLGNLENLELLDLTSNYISVIPESIGNLSTLKYLVLRENDLSFLPETLGNLINLEVLDLKFNSYLRGIPSHLLTLSSECRIDLSGCGLSSNTLNSLRTVMNRPQYSGPRISYSISDRVTNTAEEKNVQDSINVLYNILDRQILPIEVCFPELSKRQTPELKSWLNRLSDTADYKAGNKVKESFAASILQYLVFADRNQEFRSIFYTVIEDASQTCGDRVSLSVLYLNIAYRLATLNLQGDIREIFHFLINGSWTIQLLESFARERVIPTLPFYDEIEIYFALFIKLRTELDIPINDVTEMLYFECSALRERDLKEAKAFVLSQREITNERMLEFLIDNETWETALSIHYPEELKMIRDRRNFSVSSEYDYPNYHEIQQKYKREMLSLTKKVLANFFCMY